MDPLLIAATAAVGAVAGLFAGMLGIGGGVIMTPMLLLVLQEAGATPAEAATGALATSLAAILFTAVPSATVHAMHGSVSWRALVWLWPAAAVGAFAAAKVALVLHPVLLVALLTAVLVVAVARIALSGSKGSGRQEARDPPGPAVSSVGLAAGFIGALTGTGGGFVVAPLLTHLGMPLVAAIGTSAGNVAVVSVSATLSFAGKGLSLPLLAALAPTTLVMAAVGARLANVMPTGKLRIVYAACLTVIIARLLVWMWVELQA